MFETDELWDCGGGAGAGGEGGAGDVRVESEGPLTPSLQSQSPARSEGEERE